MFDLRVVLGFSSFILVTIFSSLQPAYSSSNCEEVTAADGYRHRQVLYCATIEANQVVRFEWRKFKSLKDLVDNTNGPNIRMVVVIDESGLSDRGVLVNGEPRDTGILVVKTGRFVKPGGDVGDPRNVRLVRGEVSFNSEEVKRCSQNRSFRATIPAVPKESSVSLRFYNNYHDTRKLDAGDNPEDARLVGNFHIAYPGRGRCETTNDRSQLADRGNISNRSQFSLDSFVVAEGEEDFERFLLSALSSLPRYFNLIGSAKAATENLTDARVEMKFYRLENGFAAVQFNLDRPKPQSLDLGESPMLRVNDLEWRARWRTANPEFQRQTELSILGER